MAAPAFGIQDRTLRGPVEPSGEVKVKISYRERSGITYRTYDVSIVRVPVDCGSGVTATVSVRGDGYTVPNNEPGARKIRVVGGVEESWYALRGKLVAPRKAIGTVRLGGNCESGRLTWEATG